MEPKANTVVRWAWLPIPLLLLTITGLWFADLRTPYESVVLTIALNFIFSLGVSVSVAWLLARDFLERGTFGLLLLGCGMILWGMAALAGFIAGLAQHNGELEINTTITIHNTCIWMSALFQFVGVLFSGEEGRISHARGLWLSGAYGVAIGTMAMVTISALAGWAHPFFTQGQGGTVVREVVLISAIATFAFTAVLLWTENRSSPFACWYALGLGLIGTGVVGIALETVHASILSWVGRAGQLLGGVYLLKAALAAPREAREPGIILRNELVKTPYKYAVAIVIVLSIAALRLVFLQALQGRATFVVFFPAVTLVALYGGLWPGLLATVLSALLADYLYMEPLHRLRLNDPGDDLAMIIFCLSGGMISAIVESMRRAQARAQAAEVQTQIAAVRQQGFEALRASEARFRALVQNSSDIITLFDGEGTVLYQSPSIERLLGYRPEERLGRNIFHNPIVHPDDQAAKRAFFETARSRQRTPATAEFRLRHADGSWRNIEAIGQSFLQDPGVAGVVADYRDVTERKKAEGALRRQAQLLHLSYDAILVWRKDGAIEHWNRGAEQLYGFAESEALGRVTHKLLKTIHPVPWLEIEAAMRKHGQWEGELRHFAKDGHEVTVSARHQLVLGTDGIERILETNRDVTERRRTEEALQESEKKYRTIVETATEAIVIVDSKASIVFVNDRWSEIFGYSREEALRMTHFDLLFPEDVARQKERWERRQSGRKESYEVRLRRKDGNPVWTLVGTTPNFDPEGGFLGTLNMLADITESKQAEEALRESEARLHIAQTAAKLGIYDRNLISGVIHWDQRMRELWGIGPEVPISYEGFLATLHPEDRPQVEAAIDRANDPAGDGQFNVEYRAVNAADGQTRWFATNGRVLFQAGQPTRIVGSAQDITERKNFQSELERQVGERTAELQEMVGELEHFSYSIMHDMRAPLRAMRGFAEIILGDWTASPQVDARDYLRRIVVAAHRMDNLITDSLSYSKAIREHLPLGPLDVESLLCGMLETYPELQGARKYIQVKGGFPMVLGNRAGLTQCFSNLLDNAIKFAKPGQAPEIRIWAERQGGWVRILVDDKGIGIPAPMLPRRVFDMFSRGHNTGQGTGIGLALVCKVMDRMGGEVGVESKEGEGSCFWLRLKAAE